MTTSWSVTYSHALLYGLAVEGVRGFDSSRPQIDRAFDYVSEGLLVLGLIPLALRYDPIFGTYAEVDDILIDGMQGSLLTLELPRLTWCRINISADRAARELDSAIEAHHAARRSSLAHDSTLENLTAQKVLALSSLWASHLKVDRATSVARGPRVREV